MNITVVGSGYVGLSNALLLAQKNNVTIFDIDEHRVTLLKQRKSPIVDQEIDKFLDDPSIEYKVTSDLNVAYKSAKIVIIATPTNYDPEADYFDTSSVELVLNDIVEHNPDAISIIKSTVPIGFTTKIKSQLNSDNIIFSPEFLREGKALQDNLYPSRIIVGEVSDRAQEFADILADAAHKNDVPVLLTDSTEAEAIKLFANTFLAMRVAFFNEMDSYAETFNLSTKQIIEGVCLDPRIGDYYNNPSFGYGGYCLPKDTKQLLSNFKNVPNALIEATVKSNKIRKRYIAKTVSDQKPKVVGIYRLIMKSGSDNFRDAAIKDIMEQLREAGIQVVIFEPSLTNMTFEGYDLLNDFSEFISKSDLVLANRLSTELENFKEKVYTRDIFTRD